MIFRDRRNEPVRVGTAESVSGDHVVRLCARKLPTVPGRQVVRVNRVSDLSGNSRVVTNGGGFENEQRRVNQGGTALFRLQGTFPPTR